MEAKELGDFIAKIRKENQLTQAELAKRLNVTDKAVSRWERGVWQIISCHSTNCFKLGKRGFT